MSDVRMNTTLFEYHVRITFDGTHPMKVLRFLRKFVETCHQLDMTEMEAFVMLPFFLKDSTLCSFNLPTECAGLPTSVQTTVHPQLTGYSVPTRLTRRFTKLSTSSDRPSRSKKKQIWSTLTDLKSYKPAAALTIPMTSWYPRTSSRLTAVPKLYYAKLSRTLASSPYLSCSVRHLTTETPPKQA